MSEVLRNDRLLLIHLLLRDAWSSTEW